jgi:hypothetical protein
MTPDAQTPVRLFSTNLAREDFCSKKNKFYTVFFVANKFNVEVHPPNGRLHDQLVDDAFASDDGQGSEQTTLKV